MPRASASGANGSQNSTKLTERKSNESILKDNDRRRGNGRLVHRHGGSRPCSQRQQQPTIGSAIHQLADSDKNACKGQNACKGKGGCKTGDNGCKGKNSCKGKGGCATDGSKM